MILAFRNLKTEAIVKMVLQREEAGFLPLLSFGPTKRDRNHSDEG
jgi:hypothetical protein